MKPRVAVKYQHDPADLARIWLAVVPAEKTLRPPRDDEWQPALRDVIDGVPAVWVRSDVRGTVWLRDNKRPDRVVTPL